MDTSSDEKKHFEVADIFKSWVSGTTEPISLSRDFWMPDKSCRVCYDCDSQFTIFNRRHHCRLCGRVFCSACTANSIPVPHSDDRPDCKRIRVCNYCFKQAEVADTGIQTTSPGLSPSPSSASLVSANSSGTPNSNLGYSTPQFQRLPHYSDPTLSPSAQMDPGTTKQESINPISDIGDEPSDSFGFFTNRSDDDSEDCGDYRQDSEGRHQTQTHGYYGPVEFDEKEHGYGSSKVHRVEGLNDARDLSCSPIHDGLESLELGGNKVDEHHNVVEGETDASIYGSQVTNVEPVDFENNLSFFLPPEPENEEDEREAILSDDDDGDATGEWGYLRSSNSFGSGESRNRDRSTEEHRNVMKNVVDGHFRALVTQLLQVEDLPVGDGNDQDNWLEIITSLSWEAATLLKPDTSKGGGMDPGGYVKIKCLACGHPTDSVVVKGVVCKKNVAHRRMTSKIEKPRILVLGGALEYQRVTNHLSSFDTLLQQEMDHLKMAVAKIDAQHPNVLLVEKSVSRFAQEYLLAKDISLVLNIKRPLLERIVRCTGAQIVPSIDHLSPQKLGYCDTFSVEKFLEEHGSAGTGGKKLVKTLMFFEGCSKPLGCTILLKGANGDQLKKIKHVLQFGVFAAYHLALETSFLADEGASLPELPLKSPITVALPDKPSHIVRSISTIPGFTAPSNDQGPLSSKESASTRTHSPILPDQNSLNKTDMIISPCGGSQSQYIGPASTFSGSATSFSSLSYPRKFPSVPLRDELPTYCSYEKKNRSSGESVMVESFTNGVDPVMTNGFEGLQSSIGDTKTDCTLMITNQQVARDLATLEPESNYSAELVSSKEEFPPSPSDHQSILVSLSTRCVSKGTVCERSHLFRIKYYGSFDKPLGRYLRDHLFDQSYQCRSCEMPSEAHIHCYTHRQGSLTIAVHKVQNILPGEREGKIWMWHRCLRCPRSNGFPPATRRIVMSDAAWGLSFGKFLELSFSNHAAASRVASCGHSLHRDCLRFYGFGTMVACFRYASIDVHSVYLPPPKLDFNYDNQEWIQNEVNEVVDKAKLLFTEVLNVLGQIVEKRFDTGSFNISGTAAKSRRLIAEMERLLQKEKEEFEESLQKALNKDLKKGQPIIDILEINRLRRQLLFHSYVWDHRLINLAREQSSNPNPNEKSATFIEKLSGINSVSEQAKGFTSHDSLLVDAKLNENDNVGEAGVDHDQLRFGHQENSTDQDIKHSLSTWKTLDENSAPLDCGVPVRRVLSEGQFPVATNLSDSLEAAWTGENHLGSSTPKENGFVYQEIPSADSLVMEKSVLERGESEEYSESRGMLVASQSFETMLPQLPVKAADIIEDFTSWMRTPFLTFYRSFNKNSSGTTPDFYNLCEYNPVYVSLLQKLEFQGGARLLLPVGVNDNVVPIYDDEPTSIIAYALLSPEYYSRMSNERERPNKVSSLSLSSLDMMNFHSLQSLDEASFEPHRSFDSAGESTLLMSGSRSSLSLDSQPSTKASNIRVSFSDNGPLGKVNYGVTCYFARRFEALRRICCPSELDYIRSLSRCKKWGAQGGKSNVFFAKSLDDRFIIKQVTKTELDSFFTFAPEYFKYLSESISTGSPTCLAKILGIYQVTAKHFKGGKELKMDVLVMENLLFRRNVTRLYDLKGSSRSRYNSDASGSNKVLLDQNLIETMPTSPIFVGNKAKRLLERAVWNDTSFLASIDVMDYSLLVGVDEKKHELVLGIIDFMRQYTWDKHLETWVKSSGILGGPRNAPPTVISPMQYKKRFRKAMSAYFLMVPDQWLPSGIIPSMSHSDLCEQNTQGGESHNQ